MNFLRWLFGIPIALGLSLFFFNLINEDSEFQAMLGNNIYVIAYFLTLIVIIFTIIFILFSTFLVPAPKRYGALISSAICVIHSFYWMLFSIHPFALPSSKVFYIGSYAGIIAGFTLSYLLFNNRGWRKNTSVSASE
jgi:hypothetical protein